MFVFSFSWFGIHKTHHRGNRVGTLKIRFIKQQTAYRASHYPGAKLLHAKTVTFSNDNYDNIMCFILFTEV